VEDFQKTLGQNGQRPGSAAGPDCYCGSLGDSNCDYTVVVTATDGAATKLQIHGVTTKETWDIGLTFGTCSQYMGGAQVAVVGGQVSAPGVYNFVLGSRHIVLDI
jgi:hypothetical protein